MQALTRCRQCLPPFCCPDGGISPRWWREKVPLLRHNRQLTVFYRRSIDAGNMPLYSTDQVTIFRRASVDNQGIELYPQDRVEAYLQLSSFVVPYNPVLGVTNKGSAFKAVFASNQSVPSLNDILGTYVTQKVSKARARQYSITNGPYRRSRAEVRL